jgi:hypothetical protein
LAVLNVPVSATVAVHANFRRLWMAHNNAIELCVRYGFKAPTALFVGDRKEPILIDCGTLQMAVEQGWGAATNADEPAPVFKPNTDHDLNVLNVGVDAGPTFK